ncbi:MAG: nucleotidyltransferase domain-containing protein [Methanosarcinales archaeon]|nr:MAG: nucleotidyltransferase domain-containing protein [Methanosarcinales archaeon]
MILENVLGNRSKIRILKSLAENDVESVSKLAELCGMSKKVIYEGVLELEKLGVISIDKSMKNWRIRINRKHPAAALITSTMKREEEITARFIAERLPKEYIEKIVWFGSTYKGTARPNSDIDISVISKLSKYATYKKIINILSELEKMISRDIHLEVIPKKDVDSSRRFLLKGKILYGE